ncbi:S-adenosyl-L-methionine-dependent methyltransferase [Trametes polyzona]|nr:S-adenosyl-L-methionine-dependent methyltransferase [Trametes polyzona]
MTTFATLRALHNLIGDALADIEAVYRTPPGGGGPLDYPSLDVPFYKGAQDATLERAKAEKLTTEPAVVTAADRIVAACGQIAATLHKPYFQLCEGHMATVITSCVGFVEASHTVEILRAAGPEGLHTTEIASRIDDLRRAVDPNVAPLDSGKLGHILRLLATHHWFREVKPDVFANNRLSAIMDSGKTVDELRAAPEKKYDGTDGVAAHVAMKSDEFAKAATSLIDQLLPERPRSVATRKLLHDASGSSDVSPESYKTAFNLALRTPLGYFQWLELPENEMRLTNFGRAMTAVRAWEVAENILDAYPWKDLPSGSVVVDVGGGIGSTSMVLAEAFPNLRCVVQDRPKVIEVAPSLWNKPVHTALMVAGRVSFMAQDFFEPQPTSLNIPKIGSVSAPAVYLIRGCVHNWPDAAVLRYAMLSYLRDRAAPATKLLIVDVVLPHACADTADEEPIPGAEPTLVPAGSPLLANLGKASASLYMLDILMIAMLDGKERTLREVSVLARRAGWKVTGTTRGAGSLWGYTAAEPV